MTNHAIARSFTLLADLLELEGENLFKVRAYRKAAEEIEGLTENLESIAARGELEAIPNIGKAIAEKIQQLCATGKMKQLEEARQRTPEGLVDILALPGFGPKKVQLLRQKLGITNLDQFEEAVRSGAVAATPGLGLRADDDLLAKTAAYRRRSSRWPIGRALPYASSLARALRETGACARVEVAGSIRRMCDTAADINLVAEASDPTAARAAFLGLGEVSGVVEDLTGKLAVPRWIRAASHAGPGITLTVADAARFGGRLWRVTGSAAHVEQLERYAAARGRSLDDADATEEGLFSALGLPWITPELREGRGEVEAAAEGRLPALVTAAAIRGILHAHSDWSDGTATLAQMAAAARALGQQFLAITDHSQRLGMAHGLDETRVRAQMAEIDVLNASGGDGFRILRGIEVDILWDGSLDLPPELLNELDIVVGSVHSAFRQDEATMTQRITAAMQTGCVDIIAHPTGRILGARDPYALNIDGLIEAAAANGVALEINAHPDRLDLHDRYARQAAEAGVPISVNTDAHHPDHLGMLSYGIATARRAWLTPEQIINCWPLDRLRDWLRNRS